MIVEEFLKTYADVLLHGSWLVVGIAFVAGLLSSAICPFTLPVGLGVAGVVGTAESRVRGSGLPIATAFFAGLVLSLTDSKETERTIIHDLLLNLLYDLSKDQTFPDNRRLTSNE